jgi:hypothetical protein
VNRNLFFRILLGLVVVAVLVGAGFALFNAGAAYGLSQSGVWAERMGPGMMQRGTPWMIGPHVGWGLRPFGWGFGLLGFVFQILLFVGLIWLVSRLFFGWGRWGGWRGNGDWEQRRQQMFEEWHRRAHEQSNPPQPPPSA